MKTLFTFFIFFSFTKILTAQEFVLNTTRFVGGDSTCGYSQIKYSIPSKDGGILFVGLTTCYSGAGDIPPNFPDTSGSDLGNVLIGKLDSNLDVAWVKVYGGNRLDYAVSAIQTADGGYAVLANSESNDIDVSGNHGAETGDLWLIRIDNLGNLLWQKCYGSIYDEQAGAIALAPDNGFIFYGISNGSGDDVPTHYSGSDFDYDWVVVKTDSAGNKQWAKSIGGLGDEQSYGSIISVNNAYYLVSTSNSTDYDCIDTAWCAGNGHGTGYNYYIFKLDTTAGNILWDSSYGGSGGEIVYNAIWDGRDSSIVMNGLTNSTDYMVTGYHGGDADMWVVKTDKNGVLKWETCMGGIEEEEGSSIVLSQDGYIAYGSTNTGMIGLQNALLFSINTVGTQIASKQIGGTGIEWMASILPFKQGYAATGYTNSLSFTEGINVGHLPGLIGETFISYIDYWPLIVPNISANKQLVIYPNPTSGNIDILLPGNENGQLSILNSIGECRYNVSTKKKESYINIDIGYLSHGLYIVKWQGEDGTVLVNRFIKN